MQQNESQVQTVSTQLLHPGASATPVAHSSWAHVGGSVVVVVGAMVVVVVGVTPQPHAGEQLAVAPQVFPHSSWASLAQMSSHESPQQKESQLQTVETQALQSSTSARPVTHSSWLHIDGTVVVVVGGAVVVELDVTVVVVGAVLVVLDVTVVVVAPEQSHPMLQLAAETQGSAQSTCASFTHVSSHSVVQQKASQAHTMDTQLLQPSWRATPVAHSS